MNGVAIWAFLPVIALVVGWLVREVIVLKARPVDGSYWSRMLDSVQRLQAGIPSPAFSKPGEPARRIEIAPGVKMHDAHTALAMIVSGRWGPDAQKKLVAAVGYDTVQRLEASLLEAVEYNLEKEG